MNARSALVAAIACGLLAVGVVAMDVAWSVEARIETRLDGEWVTVATAPAAEHARPLSPLSCAGPDLRLVIDNDRPFGSTIHFLVTHTNASSGRETTAVNLDWAFERFSTRAYEFRVPDEAFPKNTTTGSDPKPLEPYQRSVYLQAQVNDHYMSLSVCPEASS